MEKRLQVNCSPNTYKRIETDVEYRQAVSLQRLSDMNEEYDEFVFSSNGVDLSSSSGIEVASLSGIEDACSSGVNAKNSGSSRFDISDAGTEKQTWIDAPIKLMLSLINELRPQVGKSANVKNKKKMWVVIAQKLAAEGYIFNASQVETKFRGMKRQYKKTKLHNSRTGQNRQTCPYQSELDDVLKDRIGIYPEYVLDSETQVGVEAFETLDDSNLTSEDDSQPVPSPAHRSVQEQILERVDSMAEERRIYHPKTLKLMEKKEERAARREERSEQKLKLLEAYMHVRVKMNTKYIYTYIYVHTHTYI